MRTSVRLWVKGTRYHKAKDLYRRGFLSVGTLIHLEHQLNNPHDKNAVAVKVRGSGDMLGHIAREYAPKYAAITDDGRLIEAKIADLNNNNDYLNILVQVLYEQSDIEIAAKSKRHGTPFWQSATNLPTSAGVYSIRNIKSGRQYIGSSVNLRDRIRRHIKDLSTGRHSNHVLQSDYSHYGADYFEATLLHEVISASDRERVEEERIASLLASGASLYNLTVTGQGIGHQPQDYLMSDPVSDRPRNYKVHHPKQPVIAKEQGSNSKSVTHERSPEPTTTVIARDNRYVPSRKKDHPRGATPLEKSPDDTTDRYVTEDARFSSGVIRERVCKAAGESRYRDLIRKAASNRRFAKKAIREFSRHKGLSAFRATELLLLASVQKVLRAEAKNGPPESVEWYPLPDSEPFTDQDLKLLIKSFAWAARLG